MQKIQLYLVKNRITIVAGDSGGITEYRQVYQRKIKIYKGITQTIEFEVKNNDQKRVDVRGYTPMVKVFDINQKFMFSKAGTPVLSSKGLFTVTIAPTDTDLLDPQEFKLVAYLQPADSNATNQILYSDSQYGVQVTCQLMDGYNDLRSTATGIGQLIKDFFINYGENTFYSEMVPFTVQNADFSIDSSNNMPINGANTNYLVTNVDVEYVAGDYSGTIEVQGCSEVSTAIGNKWKTMRTDTVTAGSTTTVTLMGDYQYIRFKLQNTATPQNRNTSTLVDSITVFN